MLRWFFCEPTTLCYRTPGKVLKQFIDQNLKVGGKTTLAGLEFCPCFSRVFNKQIGTHTYMFSWK